MSNSKIIINLENARRHEAGFKAYFHEQFEKGFKRTKRIICNLNTDDFKSYSKGFVLRITQHNSVLATTINQSEINELRYEKWNEIANFLFHFDESNVERRMNNA